MSKYKVSQVLKVLGGFKTGCYNTGEESVGELFEVVREEDVCDINIEGWAPYLHDKEDYVILKSLKNGRVVCFNEDIEVEFIPFSIGEEVVIIGHSVGHYYEVEDIVKIIKVSLYSNKYYVEVKRDGDEYTQTVGLNDVDKIKETILTINDANEATYYENGTKVKVKVKENVLQDFLGKLKPFVPHLESSYGKGSYGVLGEATKLKDSLDAPLFIGDVVGIYRNGFEVSACVIAKDDERHGAFVCGWKTSMSELAMESNSFNNDIKLRKVKGFEELENGYEIGGVIVIREEK